MLLIANPNTSIAKASERSPPPTKKLEEAAREKRDGMNIKQGGQSIQSERHSQVHQTPLKDEDEDNYEDDQQ